MADPVSDSSEQSVDPHWYKRAVFYEDRMRDVIDDRHERLVVLSVFHSRPRVKLMSQQNVPFTSVR